MNKLVSIIIPVYNVESYLSESLSSAVNQTYKNLEIICVDDGSTDSSPKILAEYAEKDERIRILEKENGGLSSARNAGLDASGGEYVYYFDSDDWIRADAIERCVEESERGKLDVIFFDAESVFENESIKEQMPYYIGYYTRKELYSEVSGGADMFCRMVPVEDYKPSACLQFARRSFLIKNKLKFVEGLLFEDNIYTFKLMLLAERAKHIPENLYFRRIRANSITASEIKASEIYSLYQTLKEMQKILLLYGTAPETQAIGTLHIRNHQKYAAIKISQAEEEQRQAVRDMLDSDDALKYCLSVESIADEITDKKKLAKELEMAKEELEGTRRSGRGLKWLKSR